MRTHICRQAAANAAYRERLLASASPSPTRRPASAGAAPAAAPAASKRGAAAAAAVGVGSNASRALWGGATPIPDFDSLHGAWAARLAAVKAANRRRATVPQVGGRRRGGRGMQFTPLLIWLALPACCCVVLQLDVCGSRLAAQV